ncbi:MAG TPA: FABP family protein [Acidimicrobiales bacterium]|nr:FABP family protein [Acidimicrobiales bacterium]
MSTPTDDGGDRDSPTPPDLRPEVTALGFLLGTWSGRGHGHYPGIDAFDYDETITFSHVGRPFVAYVQRTFGAVDGRPLHAETGYLRLARPDWAELVVSHPTGVAEVEEGFFDGSRLRLSSRVVACTGSAKEVTAIERDIEVVGDRIGYVLRMAAVGRPLMEHLTAELYRVR